MIRKLVFTAALLAPGVAYAANPSAAFSDQVVPAGSDPIACAIGPAYTGSIPAPAVAAGWTTCVANYDFTTSSNFTFGGNAYNFSNMSSWLSCAGGSGPSSPLWGDDNWGGGNTPCSYMTIGADPLYPSTVPQVLKLTIPSGSTTAVELGTANTNNGTSGTSIWAAFPTTNMYVQTTFRLDAPSISSYCTGGCASGTGGYLGTVDFWSVGTTSASVEVDFIEVFGAGTFAQSALNSAGAGGQSYGNFTLDSNYHVQASLTTAKAGVGLSLCDYLDGVAASSGSCAFSTANQSLAQMEGYLINGAAFNARGALSGAIPYYLKSVVVFSCAGWNNTNPPTFTTGSTNNCVPSQVFTAAPAY